MTITVKTTWDNVQHEDDAGIRVAKKVFKENAIKAGKTTGEYTVIDNLNSTSVWADQIAVDEWTTFITALAATRGYGVTVSIV
jgi:hypothetical protein